VSVTWHRVVAVVRRTLKTAGSTIGRPKAHDWNNSTDWKPNDILHGQILVILQHLLDSVYVQRKCVFKVRRLMKSGVTLTDFYRSVENIALCRKYFAE